MVAVERITVRARWAAQAPTPVRISVQPRARVQMAARPINALWERRGWRTEMTPRGTAYLGEVRAFDPRSNVTRIFEGRIETGGGHTAALVRKPPPALLQRHPKKLCFHTRGQGWYAMNWYPGTSDVDETIGYVEKTLTEALALGRRS